jgi:multimeric flavodoxin WrbA
MEVKIVKNILVITGSPRKNGNSTILANAFIAGAKTKGHKIMVFEAGRKNIKGCIACDTCFTKKYGCSLNDDFNEIVPMYEVADIIVFSTPLYAYTFPTQMKAVMEKIYAFVISKKPLKIKEAILMVCGGASDIKNYDGIIKTYELLLNDRGWENNSILITPNIRNIGDINNTEWLKKAENIGLNIV